MSIIAKFVNKLLTFQASRKDRCFRLPKSISSWVWRIKNKISEKQPTKNEEKETPTQRCYNTNIYYDRKTCLYASNYLNEIDLERHDMYW